MSDKAKAPTQDLAAVLRALRDNPGLTRALIDPTATGEKKAELIDQVFAVLGAPARQSLKQASEQTWKTTKAFIAWVETQVVKTAWQWAQELGVLEKALEEVFSFSQMVAHNHEVRSAITDRRTPAAVRQDLVRSLLAGSMSEPAVQVAMAAVASRAGTIDHVLRSFQQIGAETIGARLAIVTVAKPLPSEQKERLRMALTEHMGAKTIIQEIVDPTVLGGVRVESGSQVIEATMNSRLEAARKDFA